MAWFEHGEMRIYYEESGSGDPVLVLPGWGGSIDELAPLREALASAYRVIAADVPGSGKSGPQPRTYTPSYYHDDAARVPRISRRDRGDAGAPRRLQRWGRVRASHGGLQPEAVRSVVTWGSAGALPDAPELTEAILVIGR